MADSVAGTNIIEWCLCRSEGMWRCMQERSVKPSAQPTLVRTQHLPPPAKTARSLRKRGPAGRFILTTPCIRLCHCGSMHGSVRVHMVYSVRAKLAVRITARFADPRPFCPVSRPPDCRASRLAGSSPSCSRHAAGWPCSYPRAGRAAGSARAIFSSRLHGRDRVCVAATGWKTSRAPWRAALARIWTPRRAAASCTTGSRRPTRQGLDPAEPVIYLSWTGDGPVMYLRYLRR